MSADNTVIPGIEGKGVLSALDAQTGVIRLIHQVQRGRACGCVCAQCGAPVIARKGESGKVTHHFAHQPGSATETRACRETALHNAAKVLIATDLPAFLVPERILSRPARRFFLPEPQVVTFAEPLVSKQHVPRLDGEVEPTGTPIAPMQPDAWVDTPLGRIYVEIWVTHKTEKVKADAYERQGMLALEIDLSEQAKTGVSFVHLSQLLKEEAPRHWLSYPPPADLANRLAHYEKQVTLLTSAETQAIDADLRKGDLVEWASGGPVVLETLYFADEAEPVPDRDSSNASVDALPDWRSNWESPFINHRSYVDPIWVGTTVQLDRVYRRKGYWLCDTLGMAGVPIFVDPDAHALSDISKRYRKRRRKEMTAFVLRDDKLTLYLPSLEEAFRVLDRLVQSHPPLPSFEVQRLELEGSDKGSHLFPASCWVVPPLTERKTQTIRKAVIRSGLSKILARALIEYEIASLVISDNEQGVYGITRVDNAESLGGMLDGHEVYDRLRESLEDGVREPCIFAAGNSWPVTSGSRDISHLLRMDEGALYFEVPGLGPVPILLGDPAYHVDDGIGHFAEVSELFSHYLSFHASPALLEGLESEAVRNQVLRHVIPKYSRFLMAKGLDEIESALSSVGVSSSRCKEIVNQELEGAFLEIGLDCDLKLSFPQLELIAKFNLQHLLPLAMFKEAETSRVQVNLINGSTLSAALLQRYGADRLPALDPGEIKRHFVQVLSEQVAEKVDSWNVAPGLMATLDDEIEVRTNPDLLIELGTWQCVLVAQTRSWSFQGRNVDIALTFDTGRTDAMGRNVFLHPAAEHWQKIVEGAVTINELIRESLPPVRPNV